eukprot:m.306788 g.306788  ORF g.306788 m.306788 type:complete len:206 (+) comp41585_c0_seq1:103-720(+)
MKFLIVLAAIAAVSLARPAKIDAPENAITCEVCKMAMEYVEKFVSNETEVENAMEKVCDYLPTSFQSQCKSLVDQYLPEILDILKSANPDEVCSLIHLCTSSALAPLNKVEGNSFCSICELVMGEVQKLLNDSSVQTAIEAALEKVCSLLPASLKDECNSLVSTYGKQILSILENESPEEVCSLMQLCDGDMLAAETAFNLETVL